MENILSIFVKAVFVENMVFAFFFGMCSYIAVSKSVKTAMGLGIAVTFVMVTTVPLNYLLNEYVLSPGALAWINPEFGTDGAHPVDLSFLSFIVFIAVIASFVQLVEMVVEKFTPTLYNQLGIFLPLIAVNCAILGGSLFMQERICDTRRGFCLCTGLWSRLVVGHCLDGGYSGKDGLFQCPGPVARCWNHLYSDRSDGYCLHDFPRNPIVEIELVLK